MNPHKIPYNEIVPLTRLDYSKIYNDLSTRLSVDEMIFGKWRAGFGGVIQWDMPPEYNWRPITEVTSFERAEAMALYNTLRESAMVRLGSNKTLIEAVYSIPDMSMMYIARDGSGRLKIMLVGWGYSYPNLPPVNPLAWRPDGEQPVRVKFVDKGEAAIVTIDINHASGYSKTIATDSQGEIDLGAHRPGTRFNFTVNGYNRALTLDVAAGKELYLYDLTVVEPVTPQAPPEVPVEEVVPPIMPDVRVNLYRGEKERVTTGLVAVSASGRLLYSTKVDADGGVNIPMTVLGMSRPVDVRLSQGKREMPVATIDYDPREDNYEIHYNEERAHSDNGWLLILLGIAATAGVAYLLGSIEWPL